MRYLHVAEYDDLLEFVRKQRVADVIVFFDKKMPAFPDNLRALRVDVYDHDFPPFRGVLEDPRGKKDMTGPILKSKAATLPSAAGKEKCFFMVNDIRLSKNGNDVKNQTSPSCGICGTRYSIPFFTALSSIKPASVSLTFR
jgi:hypothetical protein